METRDIMRKDVIAIEVYKTVKDAMEKMSTKGVTSLIVVDAENGDNLGIITRKDILGEIIAHKRDPKDVKVSDIMSEPLLTITPDMDIVHVSRLMAKTNIRRFPVIENDKLVGLISNSDIFKAKFNQ